MLYEVAVLPRARRQIAEARDWWDLNRVAAPALLRDEIDRALDRISGSPKVGTPWPLREGVRRLVLARIGFILLYRVRERARRVEVLALWHGRRGHPPPGL
ncbi:MAG: type II toxin-antitoxin system RelE/ParE family toxin [Myxococcales bacterium]|nr:type II toxin-antitoxin system RelE/ParE family toxin [Myxococcales bacterium]